MGILIWPTRVKVHCHPGLWKCRAPKSQTLHPTCRVWGSEGLDWAVRERFRVWSCISETERRLYKGMFKALGPRVEHGKGRRSSVGLLSKAKRAIEV